MLCNIWRISVRLYVCSKRNCLPNTFWQANICILSLTTKPKVPHISRQLCYALNKTHKWRDQIQLAVCLSVGPGGSFGRAREFCELSYYHSAKFSSKIKRQETNRYLHNSRELVERCVRLFAPPLNLRHTRQRCKFQGRALRTTLLPTI